MLSGSTRRVTVTIRRSVDFAALCANISVSFRKARRPESLQSSTRIWSEAFDSMQTLKLSCCAAVAQRAALFTQAPNPRHSRAASRARGARCRPLASLLPFGSDPAEPDKPVFESWPPCGEATLFEARYALAGSLQSSGPCARLFACAAPAHTCICIVVR